ncbi:hypothetical protein [Actinoallomurus acaciae]|uniref:Uncharacterized protein n=1 Tax=Actinoallomurus acaciae TaxID=502577 RepID=A0ABV5YGZ2_9ACTN
MSAAVVREGVPDEERVPARVLRRRATDLRPDVAGVLRKKAMNGRTIQTEIITILSRRVDQRGVPVSRG